MAHEFWIAPQIFHAEEVAALNASLRVGTMLNGEELPLLNDNIDSFTITRRGVSMTVEGADGDLPALSVKPSGPGLNVIAYRSLPQETTFEDLAAFRAYLSYEGLAEIEASHLARDLPVAGITETYRRYAKSLVQVGDIGIGDQDAPTGGPFEIVALENPYQPDVTTARFQLFRAGEPAMDHPVALLRYDGEVRRHLLRTDSTGHLEIAISGGGFFLLNAVDIQPAEHSEVMWQSEWASLTFGLPIRDPEPHPLDPLTKLEIVSAVRAIGASGRADKDTRLSLLTLDDPEKSEVLNWQPGADPARRAFAVVRNGVQTFEAIVDLTSGKLIEWTPRPGVQPPIDPAEWAMAQRLTKADPRWLDAMRARGFGDPSKIFCESLTVGHFGAEEQGRRLLKMPCYDVSDAETNIYGRPIGGVLSIVDLDQGQVLEVIDEGESPLSMDAHELSEEAQASLDPPLRPVMNHAPQGANFSRDGRLVDWGAWSFHLGFDQRFGPVLSLVTFRDGAAARSILYQGHLSEIFVPYMDPDKGWYFRSYLDAGEYGVGAHAAPLHPGLDCPDGAEYLDAVLSSRVGAPETRDRVMCVFERAAPMPLWRHYESLNGTHEARPSVELVVRSIPSVGNYDYVIDWVFDQRGEVAVQVGATGIDAVKAVDDAQTGAAAETGNIVAPNLLAVHHDHYFSFRLDLDVDGPENTFRRRKLSPVRFSKESPRKSAWRLEDAPMATEGGLSMRTGPELWSVETTGEPTSLGHQSSYQIQVRSDATSLLSPDDPPQIRAAFSGETLWVTAQRKNERFAAGPYPNQSSGGAGIPAYVDGESTENTDVVTWATIGFHHVTRPEDWPVLPTMRHELRLRPYGFFKRNPSIGARRDFIGISGN